MTKRDHRSTAEWRILIEQQAQSGLTGVAFCDQQGLYAKTFYRQRKILRQNHRGVVAGQFIKVQPKPIQAMRLQPAAVLQYRDSRLQLPVGADAIWLAQLMKAVR